MDYIVCGWYTPDYKFWFDGLEKSLIQYHIPYDFKAVEKLQGGWERNTCRKAAFVLEAMQLYPDKAVIFLDVDCIVTGDIGKLIHLPCDVAQYLEISRKRRRIKLIPNTRCMVLQPTPKTYELVNVWARISAQPEYGLNDQETLTLAIGEVTGLRIFGLDGGAYGTLSHFGANKMPSNVHITRRDLFWHKAGQILYPLRYFWNKDRWLQQESLESSNRTSDRYGATDV